MITNYGWSISFEGSGISADWLGQQQLHRDPTNRRP
jgi:hypothetical protein